AWSHWGCIGLPTPGAARGGLARGAAGPGGPWLPTGVTVPRGTLTPQHPAGEAQRKALLFGELRRAPEAPGQRASVPTGLGGQTDPRNGPPDSPPGRPSRPLPVCRPKRVPLLGTRPAPEGQRWRQALFLLPLGRRRGPRGASRTVHAPYTALSTSLGFC